MIHVLGLDGAVHKGRHVVTPEEPHVIIETVESCNGNIPVLRTLPRGDIAHFTRFCEWCFPRR